MCSTLDLLIATDSKQHLATEKLANASKIFEKPAKPSSADDRPAAKKTAGRAEGAPPSLGKHFRELR